MGTHPIFESDFDCLTVCMSTSIDVSGEIDAPLIPEKKESFMASWSNIALTGNVRDVLNAQREKIRPWSEFAEQKEFFAPAGLQEWTKRAIKNVSHYQSNYIIVFLVLMTYCVLTSPLLLIALAVSGIGSYTVSKHEGQNLQIAGKDVPSKYRYALVGVVSAPLLFIAGAGAALFWTLGATATIIGGHASFRKAPETPDPFAQEV